LSLFSIRVILSSISFNILPSSSSRGPMYCPGLSGDGIGPMGLGRRGSGRFDGSITGPIGLTRAEFSGFSSARPALFRVRIVELKSSRIRDERKYMCTRKRPEKP